MNNSGLSFHFFLRIYAKDSKYLASAVEDEHAWFAKANQQLADPGNKEKVNALFLHLQQRERSADVKFGAKRIRRILVFDEDARLRWVPEFNDKVTILLTKYQIIPKMI